MTLEDFEKTPRFFLSELQSATQALLAGKTHEFQSARVWTDTRSIQVGDFFLPIRGQRFDGHDYLQQAFQDGAVGAFVSAEKFTDHPEWAAFPNLLVVSDTTQAYLDVARFYREGINPKVIAVTGSSGKTSTKEMLFAALSPLKRCVKTEKNFNNEIGVAQTMLSLHADTEILIVEMGMRGPRQIAPLSVAAKPDVAIVINVGPAHIEFLGSLKAIAKAKLEIAEGLDPAKGILVINGDSEELSEGVQQAWNGQLSQYRLDQAEKLILTSTGSSFLYQDSSGHSQEIRLTVPGAHMVANALGVLAVGEALGFSVASMASGLARFQHAEGRGETQTLAGFHNVSVINDAYNANPQSVQASLEAFLSTYHEVQETQAQKLVLILGGMKELGEFSEAYHRALGEWLSVQEEISALFIVGEEGRWIYDEILEDFTEDDGEAALFEIHHGDAVVDIAKILLSRQDLLENSLLYLKGSRAYALEHLPALLSTVNTNSKN